MRLLCHYVNSFGARDVIGLDSPRAIKKIAGGKRVCNSRKINDIHDQPL